MPSRGCEGLALVPAGHWAILGHSREARNRCYGIYMGSIWDLYGISLGLSMWVYLIYRIYRIYVIYCVLWRQSAEKRAASKSFFGQVLLVGEGNLRKWCDPIESLFTAGEFKQRAMSSSFYFVRLWGCGMPILIFRRKIKGWICGLFPRHLTG